MRNIDGTDGVQPEEGDAAFERRREEPPLLTGRVTPRSVMVDGPEAFGSGRGMGSEVEAFGRSGAKPEARQRTPDEEETPPDDKKQQKGADKGQPEKDKKDQEKEKEEEPGKKKPPLYKRPAVIITAVVVLALLIAAAVIWWLYARQYATTDDAYIDGHVTQVSPQVAAPVKALHVTDNMLVKQGDLLVELDPTDYQVALQQAQAAVAGAEGHLVQARAQVNAAQAAVQESQAQVDAAQVQLDNAARDLDRYQNVDPRARSQQQLDNATTARKNAQAQLEQAKAKQASAEANVATAQASVKAAEGDRDKAQADVHRAEVNLGYCKIYAPTEGRVTSRTIEAGTYVTTGQAMFSLVSPDVWVTANYKETQLTDMRPGQPVTIEVDAYPGKEWHGHVDSIQAGSGSRFSILPAENATGNFVKIVQRVPVKIVFEHGDNEDDTRLLSPGLSVQPKVKIR